MYRFGIVVEFWKLRWIHNTPEEDNNNDTLKRINYAVYDRPFSFMFDNIMNINLSLMLHLKYKKHRSEKKEEVLLMAIRFKHWSYTVQNMFLDVFFQTSVAGSVHYVYQYLNYRKEYYIYLIYLQKRYSKHYADI